MLINDNNIISFLIISYLIYLSFASNSPPCEGGQGD